MKSQEAGKTDGPRYGQVVGECDVELWSVSQTERYRRCFARLGISTFDCQSAESGAVAGGTLVVVHCGFVLQESLLAELAEAPLGTVLKVEDGGGERLVAAHVGVRDREQTEQLLGGEATVEDAEAAGLVCRRPDEVGSAYNHALRKREAPYALRLTAERRPELERRMFQGAYKGVTDFVTKWLWPRPALSVTRWAAARGLTPNMITTASLVFVLAAMALFWNGWLLAGIACAWGMTFLDTVDGKLARVTLTSSPIGNVFDHGIDLIHPPFWYWAWWHALPMAVSGGEAEAVLLAAFWIVVVGYVVGRLMEGVFIAAFGLEMHAWRPVDSFFRLFTARRNPNLAILTAAALVGRPAAGLVLVASWTIVSLAFHAVRIAQAALRRASGTPLVSWLTED